MNPFNPQSSDARGAYPKTDRYYKAVKDWRRGLRPNPFGKYSAPSPSQMAMSQSLAVQYAIQQSHLQQAGSGSLPGTPGSPFSPGPGQSPSPGLEGPTEPRPNWKKRPSYTEDKEMVDELIKNFRKSREGVFTSNCCSKSCFLMVNFFLQLLEKMGRALRLNQPPANSLPVLIPLPTLQEHVVPV
jgi:hypothetical protein